MATPTKEQVEYWKLQWRIDKLEEKLDKLYAKEAKVIKAKI